MAQAQNGFILYRGASQIDGAPIVAIVTGTSGTASLNGKTGAMLQTWILPDAGANPWESVNTGADVSVCGNCKHRGAIVGGKVTGRTCYVRVYQAPLSIWKALHRGRYGVEPVNADALRLIGAGRAVRLGAYGDPAAVPSHVWRNLCADAVSHTGYTHQWRTADDTLRGLCMASVDSESELIAARSMGWRTFRVRTASQPVQHRESVCPASHEAGAKLNCVDCGLCNGAETGRRGSIVIIAHGAMASAFARMSAKLTA
jgi:hypothetical protein